MKMCSKCGVSKPETEFWKDNRPGRGAKASCIACGRAANAAFQAKHRDKLRSEARARYADAPEKDREKHLVRKYGVSLAEYRRLLAVQNGCCAICSAREIDQPTAVFHVDHCHESGAVRGLLCVSCNRMLGFGNDDPETLRRGAEYLEARRVVPQVAAEVIRAVMQVQP